MSRSRKRDHASRAASVPRHGDLPTPETLRKLRRDVVAKLYQRGRLRDEHVRAAEEIRDLWQAMGRGLAPTCHGWDMPIDKGRGHGGPDPLTRMAAREWRTWKGHYVPWAKELLRDGSRTGQREAPLHQIVFSMVLDNLGPRQIERVFGLRNGTAVALVSSSLHRYAEIAGWIRPALGRV